MVLLCMGSVYYSAIGNIIFRAPLKAISMEGNLLYSKTRNGSVASKQSSGFNS